MNLVNKWKNKNDWINFVDTQYLILKLWACQGYKWSWGAALLKSEVLSQYHYWANWKGIMNLKGLKLEQILWWAWLESL